MYANTRNQTVRRPEHVGSMSTIPTLKCSHQCRVFRRQTHDHWHTHQGPTTTTIISNLSNHLLTLIWSHRDDQGCYRFYTKACCSLLSSHAPPTAWRQLSLEHVHNILRKRANRTLAAWVVVFGRRGIFQRRFAPLSFIVRSWSRGRLLSGDFN